MLNFLIKYCYKATYFKTLKSLNEFPFKIKGLTQKFIGKPLVNPILFKNQLIAGILFKSQQIYLTLWNG
jgi:hypothetical protein